MVSMRAMVGTGALDGPFKPHDFRAVRIVVCRRLDTLGEAYSLLGGVNRRKNDYQSFFPRLQVIRPLGRSVTSDS